jgi:hypothetical protein
VPSAIAQLLAPRPATCLPELAPPFEHISGRSDASLVGHQGSLAGAGAAAAAGVTVLLVVWERKVSRERRWLAGHREYVAPLLALGVPETDCRQLHRLAVTAPTLQPWTKVGIRTALGWQLVTQARLSLDQARRWKAAGLDGRFAAAAITLGADLTQVRDLVADYLAGTNHRADIDDAWTDLAIGNTTFATHPPQQAEDLALSHMLALTTEGRQGLRTGRHWATWRYPIDGQMLADE